MGSRTPISRSIVVESVPSAVGSVCERILPELEASAFSEEEVFGVHLALEEAFLNALKHGNRMDPGKAIRIEYSVDSDRIEISVTDEGEGFDPESVPDPRCGENLYKPDGRGLLLMRSYMDEVRFSERGNSVHMVKYRGKPGAAETSD